MGEGRALQYSESTNASLLALLLNEPGATHTLLHAYSSRFRPQRRSGLGCVTGCLGPRLRPRRRGPQLHHPPPPSGSPAEVARDESYWRRVAAQYRVLDRTTNLEAGYFGMMASPVLAAYHRR